MTSDASRPRAAGSMMRTGPFSRFFWAAIVSSTGDWVTVFALIALAGKIGNESGVLVALIARILPGLFLGAAVGVITDRMDRRRLVVLADVGRGLVVPALAFVDTLPMLVVITLIMEFLSLLGQPPRTALVPRLVRRENLVTANSLMLGAAYGTVPLGAGFNWLLTLFPAVTLGGLVPALTAGLALAFLADSLTFLLSGALIASLPRIDVQADRAPVEEGNLKSSWHDFVEGARFFIEERSVRRVVVGMATALFGGGIIIVMGEGFAQDVLLADSAGFFAIITMLGIGAALGIVLVSLNEHRFTHRDLVFGLATVTSGIGLAAASLVTTIPGAAAWMAVMGLGAGAAYVMGLTHLHEHVQDDMRGRIFATLFGLMRIGLFVAMALALPLRGIFGGIDIWRLDDPTRVVLFLGGLTVIASGLGVLWSLRGLLRMPILGKETQDIIAAANRARRIRTRSNRRDSKDVE